MKFPEFISRLLKKYRLVFVIGMTVGLISCFSNFSSAQVPMQTRDNGASVGDNQNSQTAGSSGPVLLQDSHLSDNSIIIDKKFVFSTCGLNRLFL